MCDDSVRTDCGTCTNGHASEYDGALSDEDVITDGDGSRAPGVRAVVTGVIGARDEDAIGQHAPVADGHRVGSVQVHVMTKVDIVAEGEWSSAFFDVQPRAGVDRTARTPIDRTNTA